MKWATSFPFVVWLWVAALGAEQGHKPQHDGEGSEPRHLELMGELASDRVVSAQIRVSREYESSVNVLVYLLQKTPSDGHRRIFAELLGEMRARHAVWPLMRQITFAYGFTAERHPLAEYPAGKALAEIGEPAVDVILLERLRNPASEQELQLFGAVIREHHRRHPEVGRFRTADLLQKVDRRLENASLTQSERENMLTWRKNLARLVELYDAIDRGELFPAFRFHYEPPVK